MQNEFVVKFLSCADYADKDDFVRSLLTLTRGPTLADDYPVLSGTQIRYAESHAPDRTNDVSCAGAIDSARNFELFHVPGFTREETLSGLTGEIAITRLRTELFFETSGCFLLSTEVSIELAEHVRPEDAIMRIAENRSFFRNLGIAEKMAGRFEEARLKARDIISKASSKKVSVDLQFSEESSLPLIMAGAVRDDSIVTLFLNEEDTEPMAPALADGQAFFHPGWNYTVALNFSREANEKILQIMIRTQTLFFAIRYFKTYFRNEFRRLIDETEKVDQSHVAEAESIKLAFYDLLSNFNNFKNSLFPKYYAEQESLLERWHCTDDIDNIEQYIALNAETKEKAHQRFTEASNTRQNKALALIALLQVISLYGAVGDARSLYFSSQTLTVASSLGVAFCLLVYLLSLSTARFSVGLLAIVAVLSGVGLLF